MARLGNQTEGAWLLLALLAYAPLSHAEKQAAPRAEKQAAPRAEKQAATGRGAEKQAAPDPPPSLAPKLDLEGPEAEAKDRARVLFQEGVAAYRAGKYYEAVDIFLATQRIYPDTQLTFNVARAYEHLGNIAAALRYYRDYLRQADRPSDGEEVRQRVRNLERQLAERGVMQLTVLSRPEAATVLLDGKAVGITPFTAETYPGKHRLALSLDAHTTTEQVVDVDAHTARDVSVVLLPAPKPAPPAPIIVLENAKPRAVSVPTLVTLGTGLVLLGAAVVAEAASSEAGLARSSAFLAGSGLGVSGVGGVMLYFDLGPRPDRGRAAPSRQKHSATAHP
jgi:tetratricopeptide (TPR) repeat protein